MLGIPGLQGTSIRTNNLGLWWWEKFVFSKFSTMNIWPHREQENSYYFKKPILIVSSKKETKEENSQISHISISLLLLTMLMLIYKIKEYMCMIKKWKTTEVESENFPLNKFHQTLVPTSARNFSWFLPEDSNICEHIILCNICMYIYICVYIYT